LLRLGIVGLGRWGRNHVRVAKELEWEGVVKLVAVCDIDEPRAKEVASKYAVPSYYASVEEMLRKEDLDAVTIAVPIDELSRVASTACEYNVNFLVEKPVAMSSRVAKELRNRAAAKGLVAMPGFIMRFNPAIEALRKILDKEQPTYAVFKRLSRRPAHARRYSILLDLTIHDIDLARYLFGEVGRVRWCELRPVDEDLVVLLLLEVGNMLVLVHTDGVSIAKVRETDVITRSSFIRVNTDDLEIFVRKADVLESLSVRGEEPLKKELKSFLLKVRGVDVETPTLDDAVRALEIIEIAEKVNRVD